MTRESLGYAATTVRGSSDAPQAPLVGGRGPPRPARDTVKLRELPKASATAARRKAQRSTRVMTSGMVTAQRMHQWIIRSQALRPPPGGIWAQFND